MNRAIFISLVSVMFLFGCEIKPKLTVTSEQAVYESLFLEIMGNAHKEYYLVDSTEAHWFKENPYVKEEWEEYFSSQGGISSELVKTLYVVNAESLPVTWSPFLTSAKLLPSKYNVPHRSPKQQGLCEVAEGQGNISITTKEGKGFRSYYSISKVAFSSNEERALVKYSRHCAPLSGTGEFLVLFELVEKVWTVVGGRVLWVS